MLKAQKLIRITTIPLSLSVLLKHQLKYMSQYFDVIAVSSPDKILNEVGLREGVKTAPVVMTRSITPVKDLKALWQLYRMFKKEKPLIIHTHTPKAGLLGMLAGRLAGVPIRMHTVAGMPLMETTGSKKKLLVYTERLTYSCATKIYPNSGNLAQYILQNSLCKGNKIKVIGNGSSNGIDSGYFDLTPEIKLAAEERKRVLDISDNDFVFLFIGRLVKDKGIEELVNAFVSLQKNQPSIKLVLVGPFEPELDPISEEIIKIIENNSGIITVGFQQDVRPYLALSNVLTFPSYREGFPNVPMQAGCLNLPSIVTDINGCNEIIENGVNGLIIPVKNTESLRSSMELMLSNKPLYQKLQANARKMIVERYDQKYLWSLLLKEYQDLIKNKSRVS